MTANKEHYHNKGQEDASKGEHNPPWGYFQTSVGGDKQVQEEKAYSEGWRSTTDQIKKTK